MCCLVPKSPGVCWPLTQMVRTHAHRDFWAEGVQNGRWLHVLTRSVSWLSATHREKEGVWTVVCVNHWIPSCHSTVLGVILGSSRLQGRGGTLPSHG